MAAEGRILFGINRIYTVETDDQLRLECRIKGKVLAQEEKSYNPLAPGDWVSVEPDPFHPGKGLITERRLRQNAFVRYNSKRQCPQIIAANVDCLVCVASPRVPPFRPRFIDRLLLSLPQGALPLVVMNKSDQGLADADRKRFLYYRQLGCRVHLCSAKTGQGIESLAEILRGRRSVFAGQSGVGKSSLINLLRPDLHQTVGEVSQKYRRGRHTTNVAVLFPACHPSDPEIIDTPGVRELEVFGIEPEDLSRYFKEFEPYAAACRFSRCLHQNEPHCAVKEAVQSGFLPEDRYLSYLNVLHDLMQRRAFHGY